MSELKCCKLCGAFYTCNHKGECCPECTYFDEEENICLAPETLKKEKKQKEMPSITKVEEVDPETFLFEDIDDDDEEEDWLDDDEDDDIDDLDMDDLIDEDW